jgi:hypothetical protein
MIATATATYVECQESDIPSDVRWDTPRRNAGQIVEIMYGDFGRTPADVGSPYKARIDHSDGSRSYYRLAESDGGKYHVSLDGRRFCGLGFAMPHDYGFSPVVYHTREAAEAVASRYPGSKAITAR